MALTVTLLVLSGVADSVAFASCGETPQPNMLPADTESSVAKSRSKNGLPLRRMRPARQNRLPMPKTARA